MRFLSDMNRHERRRAHKVAGIREPRHLSFARANRSGGGGGGYTQAQNDAAQSAVLALSQPMIQEVYVNNIVGNNAAQGQILNIPLQNVGLNTKITIEVSGTVVATGAPDVLTKTQFGLANFFSNVRLVDLSNLERINTYGAHLHMLATLRRQNVYGAAYLNDSPMNFGSTFPVNTQPTGVGAAAQNFRFFFELPLAYHEYDLRGAIYAAVTSAQWRVQLTINPNLVASSAADPLFACWQSATANTGTVSNVTIKVIQHYLDQLPRASDGSAAVPLMSLAYNYLINNTAPTGLAANADFPVQYANFRTFLSTFAIYANGNTAVQNNNLGVGADVAYLGIQAANLVFLQKFDPYMAALQAREKLGDDCPRGVYLFDHRRKPIITNQYGNIQFVINASTVNANATLYMFYEMLAIQSQAINAGSLSAA